MRPSTNQRYKCWRIILIPVFQRNILCGFRPDGIHPRHQVVQPLTLFEVAESAFQANEALVRERRDMRGLMEALKVRAAAEGLAEDPEVSRLFAEATRILYARPTPMAEARSLVKQYQDKVLG